MTCGARATFGLGAKRRIVAPQLVVCDLPEGHEESHEGEYNGERVRWQI